MIWGPLACGSFLGWSLGANDSANVFGTAVAARIVSFRQAAILLSLAVFAGAFLQGEAGIQTYGGLAHYNHTTIMVISLSAAITVTLMTILRLPVSTSQAIVGAIAGVGLATKTMNWTGLQKVVICWLATPVGAMIIAWILYHLLGYVITHVKMSMLSRDKILWSGLIIMGIYGAYALGANNVANATGILSGQFTSQGWTDQRLAMLGGAAIALGAITYSKRVMFAVGSGIMPLDAFTALVAVASLATTVHIFAMIGVPVSTSQAIVGAIMGIGVIRGSQAIHFGPLKRIGFGWLMTPIISLILSAAGYAIFS
ncbi:MAG: anion permease [Sedimentisphaerales bacterium]|nr:anion permease [Sedimentisphaerales bacterium]